MLKLGAVKEPSIKKHLGLFFEARAAGITRQANATGAPRAAPYPPDPVPARFVGSGLF
jgi:hypothetical protein